MQIRRFNIYSILSAGLLWSLGSCAEKEQGFYPEGMDDSSLTHLSVEYAGFKLTGVPGEGEEEGDIIIDPTDDPEEELDENEKAHKLFDDYPFKPDETRLYITQYGRNNQNPTIYNPGLDPETELSSEVYAYKFQPKDGQDANWNEYFNFAAVNPEHIIDWEHVRNIGSVGNGYWLYGFYFPGSNEEPQFHVEQDQGNLDNLKKSNILGAFHQAPSLYTRLRFRLHPLMAYLKITVLVPVYTEKENSDGETNTGYLPNALQNIELLNAYTDFNINWSWSRSSDSEGPLVTLVTKTLVPEPEPEPGEPGDPDITDPDPGEGNLIEVPIDPVNIIPYLHPFITADGSESNMPSEVDIVEIPNIGDYQPGETGPDLCYKYVFSVLFPPQSFTGNFLKFVFQNPLGVKKNYYFSGANNETVGGGYLQYDKQGTLSNLTLYLPRKGNEAILVKANVDDWKTAGASTNVNMKDNKSNQGSSGNK